MLVFFYHSCTKCLHNKVWCIGSLWWFVLARVTFPLASAGRPTRGIRTWPVDSHSSPCPPAASSRIVAPPCDNYQNRFKGCLHFYCFLSFMANYLGSISSYLLCYILWSLSGCLHDAHQMVGVVIRQGWKDTIAAGSHSICWDVAHRNSADWLLHTREWGMDFIGQNIATFWALRETQSKALLFPLCTHSFTCCAFICMSNC